jgi:hypothetical protein
VVLLSAVVGLLVLLQQMPQELIAEPPSEVISPPHIADEIVIDETGLVEIVGGISVIINFPLSHTTKLLPVLEILTE